MTLAFQPSTGARASACGPVLPLQRELSLLLFILHNLRDGFLLREVLIGCFAFAVVIVCILFFRGKISVA
jgi:hypothetical protein